MENSNSLDNIYFCHKITVITVVTGLKKGDYKVVTGLKKGDNIVPVGL